MNIYLIYPRPTPDLNWGTMDGIVVVAEDTTQAAGLAKTIAGREGPDAWRPEDCELLGIAAEGTEAGVVLTSFSES